SRVHLLCHSALFFLYNRYMLPISSPSSAGHSHPNPISEKGRKSAIASDAVFRWRKARTSSGRALRKSTAAAAAVNAVTQQYTVLSFPKKRPNKVNRIKV